MEARVGAGVGGDLDGALVGFDGAFDDGESEAGAFDGVLGVVFGDAEEAAEDVREVGAADADAVVGDPDVEGVWLDGGADFDEEVGVGVLFEGVFDEIKENLRPVEAVAEDGEGFGLDVEEEGGLFLGEEGFEAFFDIEDAVVEGEGFEVEEEGFAGFEA